MKVTKAHYHNPCYYLFTDGGALIVCGKDPIHDSLIPKDTKPTRSVVDYITEHHEPIELSELPAEVLRFVRALEEEDGVES